jgi:prolyl oligopeptidase
MKIILATLLAALALVAAPEAKANPMKYPATRIDDVKDVLFGVTVRDPYRWLEDQKSPEVQKWMHAEDKLARDYLHGLPGRDAIEARLRQLYYVESVSAPIHRGHRYFYARTHVDKEKAIYYWREGEHGAEKVLLDPNTMSADGSTSLGLVRPSWDGKRVAYTLKRNNSDESTLYVMDVQSGKVSERDTIEGAKYAEPSWTPSGDGFYYTWLPEVSGEVSVSDRPGFAEVRFHELGTDPKHDPVVHEKTGDPKLFLGASLSRDGRWLFLYISHGWNSTDVYFRDLHKKTHEWTPFAVGNDAQYEVTAWKGRFYIRTNEGAPRWRMFEADARHPARAAWKEIVPESETAVLDGATLVGEHLALTWMHDASSELEVRGLDGKLLRKVALPGIGSVGQVVGNPDEDQVFYDFQSYTQPHQIWKSSVARGGAELWAEVKVPVDPSPYTVEQVWYPSKDGTRISMFIIRRKDLPRDGSTPFVLYGYGGFDVNMTPEFWSSIYVWLEAGGGWAVANLRGGGEYGEAWHKAGMGAHKQNVFDDFIGAAEYLIASGYTKPEKLAIRGGSNGGLLMGAALTQRPDLFRAVSCAVPLLDMVRYQLFGSGKTWISEYGSASASAAELKTLLAYSPYHHVVPKTRYPAVLMLSADSDDRVDPMHARKMVAELQAAQASELPILLRIEKHAGHGGADMIKQAVEQGADMFAFLMHELGMRPATTAAK